MTLDLNKFRTLIPIHALYEDSLDQLAEQTRVERFSEGEKIFSAGDQDTDILFLMAGVVTLQLDAAHQTQVVAGSETAQYAITSVNPRQFDAIAASETVTIARVDSLLLEKLLTWGESTPLAGRGESGVSSGPTTEESEWMMNMLQSHVFLKLPASNIQELFSRMEEITTQPGDEIIRYAESGEYFYMIKDGECSVNRPSNNDDETVVILGRGDSFGEEALISDAPRNASISMLTSGKLMRLAKKDFLELMNEPLLNWVNREEFDRLVREGALPVDVRLQDEYEQSGMDGARNIPLSQLRQQMDELDRNRKYALYCDTGQRSSAAAFLLSESGFDAYVLKGGLSAG
jgi:CRP-like cAMP-binding protein